MQRERWWTERARALARFVAVLGVLLVAPPARFAQRASKAPAHDDATPPVLPLLQEPEVRWSFGPFTFEAEPKVAGERVLVAGRDATGRRALVVLDSGGGRMLSRTLFSTATPLAFDAAGERVAVRTAPNRIDLYRMRGTRLFAERSLASAPSYSAPRLADEELLVREGDELARYDLGKNPPVWRARVPGAFHGAPAVRGAAVFAGWYDASGAAHLAWLERESGQVLGDALLGRHRDGRTPEDRDALVVVAHANAVFVKLASGLPSTSGGDLAWARVAFDGARLGSVTLHDLAAEPLETEDGWVAPENAREGAVRWLLTRREPGSDDRSRAIELAAPEHHTWLCASRTPASRAGDVLYLGPCAADARSLQVLWRRPASPSWRTVPIDGGLLVVEGPMLTCLGSVTPAPPPERERARERVTALERRLGEELARIASQALRSADGELAARLAQEAAVLGANGRTLELVEDQARRTPDAPRDARTDARRAALLAEERDARDEVPKALAEAAHAAAAPADKLALLTELFARAPDHPAGIEELRALLPKGAGVAPGGACGAHTWLGFLEVAAHCPLELLGRPGERPTPEQKRLEAERSGWRPDVVGYQSPRLLVVTAGAAPDAIAHTLRSGELVCDVLEQIFGGARPAAERLELVLYPTREEYLAHSGSDLGGLETVLGFTAGHFDLGAEVSRLFLPDGDEDGARLLGVSAHELTHHWLATRSSFGPPRAAASTGGFWIVEAIATWAEELRLDPERGRWSTDPARAASLDTLVNAGPKDLLAWRTLLAGAFEDYTRLETRTTCMLSLDWQLGAHAPRSPMQLFYAQGGALAHYLYEAEGGANRALLLRAVEAYYRGQPLDVAAALRLSPEQLGERVLAWARAARSAQ